VLNLDSREVGYERLRELLRELNRTNQRCYRYHHVIILW